MKNVTYFRKTVETGVDPHLVQNKQATKALPVVVV